MSKHLTNDNRARHVQISANMGQSRMAIELSYLIAANKVIRDENTKNPTFVDVYTIILIPKNLDSTFQSFTIAGRLLGVPAGMLSLLVKVVHEDGETIASEALSGHLEEGDAYITAIFPPIKFNKIGRHYLRVILEDKELEDKGHFYIDVQKQTS